MQALLVLAIGALCVYAAWKASAPPGLTPRQAAACTAAIAAIVVLQVWSAAGALRQYRLTLLGLRYAAVSAGGAPAADTLRVGGDYETADLYAAGAGIAPVAFVRVAGDSVPRAVVISARPDAESVVLVHEETMFGERLRVLGARLLAHGDTLRVGGPSGLALTLPANDRVSNGSRSVVLPAVNRNWRDRLVSRHPGPLQRTYPLADVMEALGEPGGNDLSSFFFYDEEQVGFADLDSEVSLTGPPTRDTDTLWTAQGGARRFTVAGLPFRDYAEVNLTAPERYGVRPLRSGRTTLNGPWLDFRISTPEVRSFDAKALRELSFEGRAGRPCAAPERTYRVHLSAVRQSLERSAVTFSAPPRRFESASQAVLALPCDFSGRGMRILTPSGPVAGEPGTPFTVGDGRREAIFRVDAKNLTPGGLLLLFVLLAFSAFLFLRVPVGGEIRALAVCATGVAAVRLLLGLDAAVEYPFLQEASQTGVWLAAVLPWAVLVAGCERRSAPAWFGPAQAIYTAFAVALTTVVFVDSRPKVLVLGGLTVALGVLALRGTPGLAGRWVAAAERALAGVLAWLGRLLGRGRRALVRALRAWRATRTVRRWMRRWTRRFPGTTLGLAMLAGRIALAAVNMTEALGVGGTRVGISVFYTPLSMCLLVYVVRRHERRALFGAQAKRRTPSGALGAIVDVWAYLVLAFVAVAALTADLGLALTTLPGALVFLLVVAERWSPVDAPARPGRGREVLAALSPIRVALALPLALFVLVQVQPRLALPAGDASQPQFRMQPWSTSELRLLERGDPAALQLIGQRRSEALGAMSETMRAYTRGPIDGAGYFLGKVSPELRATAAQEHAVSALLVSQWGWFGAVGVVLLLSALLAPVSRWWRAHASAAAFTQGGVFLAALVLGGLLVSSVILPQGGAWRLVTALIVVGGSGVGALCWLWRERAARPVAIPSGRVLGFPGAAAALFLLTLCGAGLYMVVANYGLVLFTGKNVYGLALDSIGDLLETLVLFAGAAFLLRRAQAGPGKQRSA
ncbi:MAG TPA: hypothetical protein VFS20_11555 [Longimicrobium sp.]|nr:hypothetical protein [Longimicrobium sp.]